MIKNEVNHMEEEKINETPETEEEGYIPRPAWQVWAARIGLVLFLIFVAYQISSIAFGGFV